MPRKKKVDEVQAIIKEIQNKEIEEDIQEAHVEVQKMIDEQRNNKDYWDVKKDENIEYFDPTLSYELGGYRPITQTQGLDFDPSWFTEVRETFLKTGHYCPYLPKSKRYNEFWKDQYKKCKYGMTVNGYTLTGDNYFFLNFYQLPLVDKNKASGEGLDEGFPVFFASHYTFFHYLNLCRLLHKHAALFKARSIGFSEINASIAARLYTIIKLSRTMITCFDDRFLNGTFGKVDHALTFLNTHTDGGMFKPRIIDKDLHKKSGYQVKVNGQFEDTGFKSEVIAINGKNPRNIRGDRVDLLIYDEAGSWPGLTTAVVQGQELCEVQGMPRGIQIFGGTGGDFGPPLEGLKKIYYHPRAFKVLPFRHNFTQDGSYIESGFFIPYYVQSLNPKYMDNRGVCNIEEYKKELQAERDNLLDVPEEYYKKCAERCWFAEEAFNLEGVNKFNKIKISEQLARIRLHKQGPRPEHGYIDYYYKGKDHSLKNIDGFKWIPNPEGKVQILEHPVWSDLYMEDIEKQRAKAQDEGRDFEAPIYKEMNDLYVAGIDGIDIGANQTSQATKDPSDFCLIIKKRAFGLNPPMIVAMYKDRPGNIREAYKIAMCMCRYYNARINIEATRIGMITWARENDGLQYFMRRPRATLADIKNGSTKQYGTPATAKIIDMHTDLTAAFVEDYCDTIWFEEILDQLTSYNDENKRKFDIIASLGMVELADQELSGRQPTNIVREEESFVDYGYWKDERGVRHFGIIPKPEPIEIPQQLRGSYDTLGIDTSDPRLHREYLRSQVYRPDSY